MLVFGQAFVRQFIWRRVISIIAFNFNFYGTKKVKKYLWHIWKAVYSGSPWVKWVESTVLVPVSFTSGLCWFQANFKLIVFLFTSPVPFRKLSLRHLAYTCLAKGKCDCTKVGKSDQFANICQIFNNVAADLFSSLKLKLRLVGHSCHWPMQCNAGKLNDQIFFLFWKFKRLVGHHGRLPMARWTKVEGQPRSLRHQILFLFWDNFAAHI